MALLEVKNLEVFYGVIQAIKGISFHVEMGELVTLIGANGAGKTTTMQSVMGLIHPKAGTITYNGKVINNVQKVATLFITKNVFSFFIVYILYKIFL